MATLHVTSAQALRVAHLLNAVRDAEAHYLATLSTLTLGTPCDGLALADVNLDTATLTFHVPHVANDQPPVNDG